MKTKQGHLISIGLLLTMALIAFSGCSGGDSAASTSSVKGTTSGLLGTVVLQNNGTDDIVVNATETFWFPTPVDDGSNCNVTILSQPTSPAQTCEVVNGSNRMVNGSDITDVEVRCVTTMLETFDNGELNSGYWHTSGEFDRKIVNGKLQFNLMSAGGYAADSLPFLALDCGKISADVTITDTVSNGTNDNGFRALLQSCSYHTATDGEEPGSRIGDVNAQIILSGDQVSYRIFRCLSNDCSTDSIEYLTPGGNGGELLGTVPLNSTATLLIDWNTLTPGQFTFQLNYNDAVSFNPVEAGWAIDATVPNKPGKNLGVRIAALSDPDDNAEMTATFDNVIVDGLLYDNFDNGKYLDGSLWQKTDGKMQIENGRVFLETGQEFVGDWDADNRFNSTSLKSHDDMILNAEVVEVDMTLDPATFVVDFGDNPAEVSAQFQMEFRPPGADEKDYTNFFVIRAALKESPLGVTAEILAQGCADFSCTSKHTIANDNQSFTTPVEKGQTYHLKIEHLGNGAIDVTLDNNETLSVDLSAITEFSSTEFSAVRLRTASRRTDIIGEEAFIRASFDNIRAGRP